MGQGTVLMGPMSTSVVSDLFTSYVREINNLLNVIACEPGFTNCHSDRKFLNGCIPNNWICDGDRDCKLIDDEANCSKFN